MCSAPNPAQAARQHPVLTVVVIEDCQDIREGLQMLISGTSGYRCVGHFKAWKRR
jgi:hypothetical protein